MRNLGEKAKNFLGPISMALSSDSPLSLRDRRKIMILGCLQALLATLDVIGVTLFAGLGALVINNVGGRVAGERLYSFLSTLRLESLSYQQLVLILSTTACLAFLLRTFLTAFFMSKVTFFLSRRSAQISQNLFRSSLVSGAFARSELSVSNLQYAINRGVDILVIQSITVFFVICTDLATFLLLIIGLFALDATLAVSTYLYFAITALVLYSYLKRKAERLGFDKANFEIKSNIMILDVFRSYRHIFVHNREQYISEEFGKLRDGSAKSIAGMSLLPYVSKLAMEIALVLGLIAVGAFQFSTQEVFRASATFVAFLAAATRLAPAILRLQQSVMSLRSISGETKETVKLLASWREKTLELDPPWPTTIHLHGAPENASYSPQISFNAVSFAYHEEESFEVSKVTFSINRGDFVAFVGPSGAGKSTLVDLMTGILTPTSGSVEVDGYPPRILRKINQHYFSYAPQDFHLMNATIRENLTFGFPSDYFEEQALLDAIQKAQLLPFVESLNFGLDTKVGEGSMSLSGGQRQRLGLARALITRPSVVILDEVTSALDAETEAAITEFLKSLKGSVTLVLIAHRLSSVALADRVMYLDSGSLRGVGSFSALRKDLPDFDKQARLLGLG